MKKVLFSSFVVLIASAGFIFAHQFSAGVWNSSDLPEMENPRIVIKKEKRTLEVFDGEKSIIVYKIALGYTPKGDKEKEGDGKTPEGEFFIHTKNEHSKYFLSLGMSYPNIEDAKRGLETELITPEEHDEIVSAISENRMPPQYTNLGGEIYIHGNGNLTDWTAGCVALTNKDMKELFDAIPVNTLVIIES